jgi:hypothetical protein
LDISKYHRSTKLKFNMTKRPNKLMSRHWNLLFGTVFKKFKNPFNFLYRYAKVSKFLERFCLIPYIPCLVISIEKVHFLSSLTKIKWLLLYLFITCYSISTFFSMKMTHQLLFCIFATSSTWVANHFYFLPVEVEQHFLTVFMNISSF